MSDDAPTIQTAPDGPYLLHGPTVIRSAEYVYSEHGEPMTFSFGDGSAVDDMVALCRCGESANRPYCDGSHQASEWDPNDGDPEGTYEERARDKAGPDGSSYAMLDDTKLCMHAGLCGTARQTVWQMLPDTGDSEVRGTVARMVEKCPSGRLTNVFDGRAVEQALPQEVNVVPGGPLWVTGGIAVSRADGTQMERRNRVTLCRCGASERKPLCDGSHTKIEFEGRS
ncbi:MAG: CDGSH iron-sulfur domain-containing protein [Actinomycetota bacterium]